MQVNDLLPREIAEQEEASDPFLTSTIEFEEAAHRLDLEDWIIARLRQNEREITLNLPLQSESGDPLTVGAMRVQHYTGGQPSLGPIRWSRAAYPQLLRAEARQHTWQAALLELPLGGAAGAIWVDPAPLSERETRELARGYVHGLRGVAGALSDVLAPGSHCNQQIMAWLVDPLATAEPLRHAAAVGKPEYLWGIPGYCTALALGIAGLIRQATAGTPSPRVALQGFGRTGSALARYLAESNAQLVAVADISGGLFRKAGLDVEALQSYMQRQAVLFGYAQADAVSNAEVLETDCDVLVLAAVERQLTVTNADRIRASLVVEATEGALTRAAEQALLARGITVIPYPVASAGNTLAGYAEWNWNLHSSLAAPPDLASLLPGRMQRLWDTLHASARELELSLRQAALHLAIRRLAEQLRLTRS